MPRKAIFQELPLIVAVFLIAAVIMMGAIWHLVIGEALAKTAKDQQRAEQIKQDIMLLDTYQEGTVRLDFSDDPYNGEFIIENRDRTGTDYGTLKTRRDVGGGPLVDDSEAESALYIFPYTELENWDENGETVEFLCVKKQRDPEPGTRYNITFERLEEKEDACTL